MNAASFPSVAEAFSNLPLANTFNDENEQVYRIPNTKFPHISIHHTKLCFLLVQEEVFLIVNLRSWHFLLLILIINLFASIFDTQKDSFSKLS